MGSLPSLGFPAGRFFPAPALWVSLCLGLLLLAPQSARAATLFADNFDRGIDGWTAVKPRGVYFNGPLRWEYDLTYNAFVERSNIYTDHPMISSSAVAPMLINGTVAHPPFVYSARMTAGDTDAFGLVFGYQNDTNFYRLYFSRLSRAGFPYRFCTVDRKTNGVWSTLVGPAASFLYTPGRAFDVTLSVDALSRISIQIVDDPLGAATPYQIVSNKTLPTFADGRVGLMTWGMGSYYPRGFRIQNLKLVPTGLQGSPNPHWTPVVPPRANGSTALSGGLGEPSWFLSANERGPGGTLTEDSDSGAGWDAPGQVDFTGPALVAGDGSWSNVVVAARIVPHDAHGQGLLLRYQNPSNFCRIGLRKNHANSYGMRPGLSVQKNINGVYTEIYRDNPVKFDPALHVPYDLVAQITANTLNILVVADTEGAAPQAYTYGPINVAGLDRGKIGLFSFAMSSVEYDQVTVREGAALYVASAYGSPNPPRGLNDFTPGQLVEASVGSVPGAPGVRRAAIGWKGSGSVPASGTGSNVAFAVGTLSHLHWQWTTQYRLAVSNGPHGTIAGPPSEWQNEHAIVSVVARPDPGYVFSGWQGDSQSMETNLTLQMDRPCEITATFAADTDFDGLPDDWERGWWGNLGQDFDGNLDQDTLRNGEEWDNGTDPTRSDVLFIEQVQSVSNAIRLAVQNNSGSRYNVDGRASMTGAWSAVARKQFAESVVLPPASGPFFRLSQPRKPAAVPPFMPGSWTLAVLPDTQIYAWKYPEWFKDQTRWIAANKTRCNIQYVLHVGDVVDSDVSNQWANASEALGLIDGQVPYALAPGNHDYGALGPARSTLINTYFPPSRFQSWPTFGGVKNAGKIENSYHLFSAGGADWLVLVLEWSPRDTTIAWADSIVDRYPDRRVILLTHAYLYSDNARYDWGTKGTNQTWNPHVYASEGDPNGANDGEELWQKLVRKHANFVFVFSGHVVAGEAGRLASTNDAGHVVHQMLANYQTQNFGGGAFLRLLEFRPDGKTVQVKTYSPYSGTYKTDPQNQFTLTLQPPLAEKR